MSFIDEMRNLRSAIDDTKEKTKTAVKLVKKDTNEILGEAQKIVAGYAQTQKANAKQLRRDLRQATQNLVRDVKAARSANIRDQRERRREFAQARAAFWKQPEKRSNL
jgi:hypothetical protein